MSIQPLAVRIEGDLIRVVPSDQIISGGGGGGVTDHGALTGLADDDHPQYLLTSAAAELIRDTIGAALVAGTGVTLTVNDAGDTITIAIDTTTEAERIRDTIGAALVAGASITLTVNDAGDTITIATTGLVAQAQTVNAQTGTTYTLAASDAGKLVTLSNASAITLTVPQDSDATITVGTYIDLYQLGAGQVTVAAGTGATLRTSGLTAKARAQYSRLGVQKVSANTWSLFGDLAAS
jgi:hypothetical protein